MEAYSWGHHNNQLYKWMISFATLPEGILKNKVLQSFLNNIDMYILHVKSHRTPVNFLSVTFQ